MSDRKPTWLEQSEAMLEALRTNQRTLQDNWTGFLEEVRSGWYDADGHDAMTDDGESVASTRESPPERDPSLGLIGSQIQGTRRTVEALGEFAKQMLGVGVSGIPDAATAWRRGGEILLEPWLQPFAPGESTPKTVEEFFDRLMAPWGAASQAYRPGLDWLRQGLGQLHQGMARSNVSASMDAWDQLSSLVGKTARHPSLGPIDPDIAQRSTEAFEAWLACLGAIQRYETLRLQTWTRVGERFVETLVEENDADKTVDSLRGLLQHWVDIGDGVLMEMYRSEKYLDLQRDLLESLMRYRVKLQDVQEAVAQSTGLPTRGELDDAYRSIQALRREVRQLKRASRVDYRSNAVGAERATEIDDLGTPDASPSAPVKKASAKKASSKKASSKKASSKKASAKKASAKKASAKKASAKKASAKKASAKKASAKKASAKKASAKKASAKKASAKKASAKKASSKKASSKKASSKKTASTAS